MTLTPQERDAFESERTDRETKIVDAMFDAGFDKARAIDESQALNGSDPAAKVEAAILLWIRTPPRPSFTGSRGP